MVSVSSPDVYLVGVSSLPGKNGSAMSTCISYYILNINKL
jgi:hypothetical protein